MDNTNHKQFEHTVKPHLNALFRTAYRLTGSRTDAEDLVQEVCLRAYPRLSELTKLSNPRAWLFRIQYRLFVDQIRHRDRSPLQPLDADLESSSAMASTAPGPEDCASAAAAGQRLSRAWERLEKDQRALLALHAEGNTIAELHHITGVPEGAMKARLHRARARLAKLLKQSPKSTSIASGEIG